MESLFPKINPHQETLNKSKSKIRDQGKIKSNEGNGNFFLKDAKFIKPSKLVQGVPD